MFSKALFHPEIASESNFDFESHLVLFLQQFVSKTVDNSWNQAISICSNPDCQNLLSVFSLASSIKPLTTSLSLLFWPSTGGINYISFLNNGTRLWGSPAHSASEYLHD